MSMLRGHIATCWSTISLPGGTDQKTAETCWDAGIWAGERPVRHLYIKCDMNPTIHVKYAATDSYVDKSQEVGATDLPFQLPYNDSYIIMEATRMIFSYLVLLL